MSKSFGIVKTHFADIWSWIALPWVILFSSFVVNLLLAGASGEGFTTGGLASIFVYVFVLGIASVSQTYSFIIGFGARRKDFFIGTATAIAIIAASSSVILTLLAWIERQTDGWGVGLHFFSLPSISDGALPVTVLFFFCSMTNIFFSGFLISSIFRRFGRNVMLLFFAVITLAMTVAAYLITYYEKWTALFDWLGGATLMQVTGTLLGLTLVYVAVTYALLRKATI
ncbi:hypothetical protein [Cohnella soli]|uniref:Integral membrane protein n=1 Tax=Cohnella soli TaxID=425005 RepID=A0ABW0HM31_9BACL